MTQEASTMHIMAVAMARKAAIMMVIPDPESITARCTLELLIASCTSYTQ